MAWRLHQGRTRAAPLPSAGQIAPKIQAERVRWSAGAHGRVPRLAQRRVSFVFWPTLASSPHQSSMALPGCRARIPATTSGKLF